MMLNVPDECVMDVGRMQFQLEGVSENGVTAVLNALEMWDGLRVPRSGRWIGRKIDFKEFRLFFFCCCLRNRHIDQEACDYMQRAHGVTTVPDVGPSQLDLPDEMRDVPSIVAIREKVAEVNVRRRAAERIIQEAVTSRKRRRGADED